MNIWTAIFLIAVICVSIIDISGFIQNIEEFLTRLLGFKVRIPKPFSCSLCSTFWASVIYAVFTNNFNLPVIAYALVMSILTPVISDVIWTVRDFLGFVVAWINTWWKI